MVRLPSPVVKLQWEENDAYNISLSVKREDLIHPIISGNKWRKLKYNIKYAKEKKFVGILSFGGAFSNHLAALAFASRSNNLKAIGMVRGDVIDENNPSIQFLKQEGMRLELIDRTSYRNKSEPKFLAELKEKYKDFFIVPEGGSNALALEGVGELVAELDEEPMDYLCVSAGTSYTAIGILTHLTPSKVRKVLVFSSLKGDFLKAEIEKYKDKIKVDWELITDYHFGGYARIDEALVSFINKFRTATEIPLDPIYNGKMFFGIKDMIQSGKIEKGSSVMAIHTGGLQGVVGHNYRYGERKELLIDV
jgi:1-aminocyclopropane-1-carboxylate deaminase